MSITKLFLATCISGLFFLPGITSAATVLYQYDSFGQLENARYDGGLQFSYVYDAIGNRETFALTAADVLAGDINGDSEIDLTDVILGLRITSGEIVDQVINKSSDVNSNNKTGLEEVIYIMQKMAE
jgi:hypothetical protein